MNGQNLEFYSCGATDVGQKRQINEDSFLCDDELGLWVVADGMGGHAAGEVASREAVDTIHGMVKRDKPKLDLSNPDSEETLRVGARLLEGRDFTEDDDQRQGAVAIVDERLARRLWPQGGAIGSEILADPTSSGAAKVLARSP